LAEGSSLNPNAGSTSRRFHCRMKPSRRSIDLKLKAAAGFSVHSPGLQRRAPWKFGVREFSIPFADNLRSIYHVQPNQNRKRPVLVGG